MIANDSKNEIKRDQKSLFLEKVTIFIKITFLQRSLSFTRITFLLSITIFTNMLFSQKWVVCQASLFSQIYYIHNYHYFHKDTMFTIIIIFTKITIFEWNVFGWFLDIAYNVKIFKIRQKVLKLLKFCCVCLCLKIFEMSENHQFVL